MPWWVYETAIEGLAEEQPWLPAQTELVEGVPREPPIEGTVAESGGLDELAALGITVRSG